MKGVCVCVCVCVCVRERERERESVVWCEQVFVCTDKVSQASQLRRAAKLTATQHMAEHFPVSM